MEMFLRAPSIFIFENLLDWHLWTTYLRNVHVQWLKLPNCLATMKYEERKKHKGSDTLKLWKQLGDHYFYVQ